MLPTDGVAEQCNSLPKGMPLFRLSFFFNEGPFRILVSIRFKFHCISVLIDLEATFERIPTTYQR